MFAEVLAAPLYGQQLHCLLINKPRKQVHFNFWRRCYVTQKSPYCYLERRTLKSETISGNWNPFKKHEKCFLIHLKKNYYLKAPGPLRGDSLLFTAKSPGISRFLKFLLTFLVILENSLIRKLRLISRFMTTTTKKQIITIHKLPKISSKGNHTIKFGLLIEHEKFFSRKILHKTWWRN